jgi:hypothetical protein
LLLGIGLIFLTRSTFFIGALAPLGRVFAFSFALFGALPLCLLRRFARGGGRRPSSRAT